MARKRAQLPQFKIRVHPDVGRKIEQAAKARNVSMSAEMAARIARSFDEDAARKIDIIADDLEVSWLRIARLFHGLNLQGDLVRAAKELLAQVDALPDTDKSDALTRATLQVERVVRVLEREATKLVAAAGTTGAI